MLGFYYCYILNNNYWDVLELLPRLKFNEFPSDLPLDDCLFILINAESLSP